MINKAKEFAKLKHKGQKDDAGLDYYEVHLLPVYNAVSILCNNQDVQIAALLHDIIEDTNTTYEELVKEFGIVVSDLVMEVTHEGKKDEYGYYFPRLKSREAILIKLCDRTNNISRMSTWSDKKKQYYLNKTKFWKDGNDKKVNV